MTQLEQMQQVISNYVKNFRPESNRFFTTYGISPEHLNPSSYKELPKEQVDNMRVAFDSITQQSKNNGSMFYQQKTAETNDFMYFGFAQDEYTKMKSSDLNCRIYLPIAEDSSHDYFMAECLKILINSGIKFTGKVAKTYRNDSLMFEFEEREHAKKFVELFMKREDLRGMLGLHNPFLRDVQGLGFVDFENFNPDDQSYTSLVAHELEDYVFELQAEDMQHGKETANIEGFKKFLEQAKADPHKNSAILDQIIGEIVHCANLHLQSIINSYLDNRKNFSRENTNNSSSTKEDTPNIEDSFNEPKEKTTVATNTQSEQEQTQDKNTITEYVKSVYEFQLVDEILKQQNINFMDSEYGSKRDELDKLTKAELFGLLGKEDCRIEAERLVNREQMINSIAEKEKGYSNPYQNPFPELEKLTDEELSIRLEKANERLEQKRRADAEREAYWEREKNKPSKDERTRIYQLGLKVGLLKFRMEEFSENGQLKDIPEKYVQSINNTIQNLLHLSDKTIVGGNGKSKSVTEVIGRLWDMSAEDAIACVDNELASGKIQDAEIINILQDFAIAKRLIPQGYSSGDYSCMPHSNKYYEVRDRWKNEFIYRTEGCYTIEDVYKKLDPYSSGESFYFFKKKIDECAEYPPDHAFNDKNFSQRILERMKEGVIQLEKSDDLTM